MSNEKFKVAQQPANAEPKAANDNSQAFDPGDVLRGGAAIAAFLGIKRRTLYNLVEHSRLPTYRQGGRLHARKSVLLKFITDQEARCRT